MSPQPAFFLRLNGEIRGPFDRNLLRQLAEIDTITPDTEASENAAGPWTRIQEATDCAGIFPERTHFRFKARLFKRAGKTGAPAVDVRELIAAANQAKPARLAANPLPLARPLNDVERILRLNRQCEKQAGLDELKPRPPVKNRRRRDYWMLLIGGNLVLFFGLKAIGGLALGGIVAVVFTAGATWVMYGLMDRY